MRFLIPKLGLASFNRSLQEKSVSWGSEVADNEAGEVQTKQHQKLFLSLANPVTLTVFHGKR